MTHTVFTIELTRADYLFTTIHVHKSGHGSMEFRGDGMWQWGFGGSQSDGSLDHVRAKGTAICWAEWLHNGLMGMHATILHAEGGPFAVHEGHDDFAFVSKLWDLAHLPEQKVLAMGNSTLRCIQDDYASERTG